MGRKFDEVFGRTESVPYKSSKAANGDAHVQVEVNGQLKTFSRQKFRPMIYRSCALMPSETRRKNHAGGHHGPAYFNRLTRNATKDAGKIAASKFAASSMSHRCVARLRS